MSDRKITDTELDGLIAECFSPLIGELTDSRLGFALVELRDLRAENERLRAAIRALTGFGSYGWMVSRTWAGREGDDHHDTIRSAHETGEEGKEK